MPVAPELVIFPSMNHSTKQYSAMKMTHYITFTVTIEIVCVCVEVGGSEQKV